jgi:hypothetical protein
MIVITGLDPVIHNEAPNMLKRNMDGRVKPGHDGVIVSAFV